MSSENSSSSKKKKIAAAAIAVALAAALMIGGTISYLQDDAGVVVNSFEVQTVDVEIDEDTGSEYEIIPGTSQEKDPHVDVDVDVASYVFVLVTDDTENLVTYSIADGWTKLEGTEDNALDLPENTTVYYRTVDADTDATYYILTDNKVSYSSTLTNDDMLEAGDNLTLSFSAIVVQQSNDFSSALEAFQASYGVDVGALLSSDDDSESSVSVTWYGTIDSISVSTTDEDGNTTEAVITINGNGTLVVSSNVTASIVVESGSDAAIELDDSATLTSASSTTVYVEEDASLDISGGTIASTATSGSNYAVDNEGGTVTLEDVTITNVSSYAIVNHGTMTLDDCTVSSESTTSSMIENGWQTASNNTDGTDCVMTINGGTYTCAFYAVKNDDYGVLTINDGTFTCTSSTSGTVLNWNELTINGGTFVSNGYVIYNTSASDSSSDAYTTYEKGELTINGGSFTSQNSSKYLMYDYNCGVITITDGTFTSASTAIGYKSTDGTYTISGGTYSSKYLAYGSSNYTGSSLVSGYELQDNGDGTYSVVMSSTDSDE